MLFRQDLWSEIGNDVCFPYDEVVAHYEGLLNECGMYNNLYYEAYSNNNPNDTVYYRKMIEQTNLLIDKVEKSYPFVINEINRNL